MESKLEPIEVTLARRWAEFRMRRLAWIGRLFAWVKGQKDAAGHSLLFLLLLGIVLNLFSIAAPGYYSHEDLTNVVYFSQESPIPAWNPLGFSDFQYRPVYNFLNALVLHLFFDMPILVHLFAVLHGVINSILFYHLILRFSGQAGAAVFGFVVFNLFPASMFAAGWVAAGADRFWMTAALGIMHFLLADRNSAVVSPYSHGVGLTHSEAWRQAGIALLFVLGLMSKETALMIPAAIVGLCLLVRPWRGWWWSVAITGAIAALYLVLRWDGLIDAPRVGIYTQSMHNVIQNTAGYWLYPWSAGIVLDIHMRIDAFLHLLFSRFGILCLSVTSSLLPVSLLLLRRRWRWALAYVFYYYIFVIPVLTVYSDLHFLYGATLPVAAMFAYALRRGESRRVTAMALTLLMLVAIGGFRISFHLYKTGVFQDRIHQQISAIVRTHDSLKKNEQTTFSLIYENRNENHISKSSLDLALFRAINFNVHTSLSRSLAVPFSEYRHRIFDYQVSARREQTPADAVKLFLTEDLHIVERQARR